MDKQEIYNKVRDHLLSQNKKSRLSWNFAEASFSRCAYRGENGLKCAIGCLIQDEFYSEEMEGLVMGPQSGILIQALKKSGIPTDEGILDLLDELQRVHDFSHPNSWRKDLSFLAKRNGLVP